jgi:hypothetical protein
MGYSSHRGYTKQDLINYVAKDWSDGDSETKLLKKAVRGSHLWMVFERTKKATGSKERFIALSLMSMDKGFGYGSKDMTEHEGLTDYDCPLEFLEMQPDAPNEYSERWREKVREFHAIQARRRQVQKSVSTGDRLKLVDGCVPSFVVVQFVQQKPRKILGTGPDGRTYRVRPRHIAEIMGE